MHIQSRFSCVYMESKKHLIVSELGLSNCIVLFSKPKTYNREL